MNLTKKIRHEIYKEALKTSKNHYNPARRGICFFLHSAICKLYKRSGIDPYGDLHKFKEVYSYKPKQAFDKHYWFSRTMTSARKRRSILKKAIKETQA